MLISTKGRYALRVMLDLATQDTDTFIPLWDIARRQNISEKYLESIISILSKAGLLIGARGKGGGYKLARPAKCYAVGEILHLTEGPLAPVSCLETAENPCERAGSCLTLPLWTSLNQLIDAFFSRVSLADLLDGTPPPAVKKALDALLSEPAIG